MSEYQDSHTRRTFLARTSCGLGAATLAQLFSSGNTAPAAGLPGFPNFTPRAKRVIYLFQNGAPTHVGGPF